MVPRFPVALLLFALVNVALASFLVPAAKPELTLADVNLTPQILEEGKPASWWLARTFLTSARVPDVVVCGSSQIGGLQAADANTSGKTVDLVFNRRCLTIENDLAKTFGPGAEVFLSALPGAMVSDHFAISRALFRPSHHPALLVLTVSPRDFIDNTLPSAGATDSYRFFSQYTDMSAYTGWAFHDPWSRFTYFVSSELPLRGQLAVFNQTVEHFVEKLKEADTASGGVACKPSSTATSAAASAAEQVKFVMGAYGGNLKPGQAVLTPNLPKIYVDNSLDYKHRYKDQYPVSYDIQFNFMHSFLAQLKQEGIKVLVVGMPLTRENRQLLSSDFWQAFRSRLAAECQYSGAEYLDLSASPNFLLGDFCDTVHLNADGGTRLAEYISKAIEKAPQLRAALKERLEPLPTVGRGRVE
ncbi:MAG: hypothetical protein QG574_1996 [Cyanobacteriota bacterium erpe_2018_sw_21hr_WHONDRS-SW48-000092_B_bin.40]|jgi:hypothetical protein|nr:hypothetical protein [Cyanobacteriota bacterium erpe_2018_sw_21hr_WHONDRS-SW48-000092_B_bin.40]